MKIAFLIRSLNIGGAERQMTLLARVLKNRGHEIVVLTLYSGGTLAKDLLDEGIEVVSLGKKGRWDIILFLNHFLKQIKEVQPQVLYSFMTVSNLLSMVVKLYRPNLKIVWGLRASNMDLKQYDWLSRLTAWFEKKCSVVPDKIIANSYAGKTYAEEIGFTENKMVVVPNGIDTERFSPNVTIREQMRQNWKIREDQYLIGLVARIDPMKDYATFFRMASILSKKRSDVRFIAMGSGNKQYQASLKNLLKELNLQEQLLWFEEQREPAETYNALDILCSSSAFGEGFSNVLGEAMSCGVPCVATDVGDAKRILGGLGKIVPIQQPEAMAEACLEILESPINKTEIRQWIIDNFSLDTMANQTELVLCQMSVAK